MTKEELARMVKMIENADLDPWDDDRAIEDVLNLIRAWPVEEPWINVKDRLPEGGQTDQGQKILIATGWSAPSDPVIAGRFFRYPDGRWQFTSMNYGVFIVPPTYWQPLPPPPEPPGESP